MSMLSLRSDLKLAEPSNLRPPNSPASRVGRTTERFQRSHRIASATLVLALATGISGGLSAASYCVGRNTEAELRFFEPWRPPTVDEALVACPIEYALRSNDRNDVIFLG